MPTDTSPAASTRPAASTAPAKTASAPRPQHPPWGIVPPETRQVQKDFASATASLDHSRNLSPSPKWQPDALGIKASVRRSLGWLLAMPCSRHSADAGQPCWTITQISFGICGDRIRRAHLAGLRVRSEAGGGGKRKAQATTKVQTS
jgi:hypothetical protein